jgi:hypothetical protein
MSFDWLHGNRSTDVLWDLQKRAQRACTYLGLRGSRTPEEIDAHVRKVCVDIQELYQYIAEADLDLLDAAFAYKATVGPRVSELIVPAMYKQVNATSLHLFLFGPYTEVFDLQNDPLNILYKTSMLKHLEKTSIKKISLHWIYTSLRENLVRTPLTYSKFSQQEVQYVQDLLTLVESGASYPLVPCRHTSCQFRKSCFPF